MSISRNLKKILLFGLLGLLILTTALAITISQVRAKTVSQLSITMQQEATIRLPNGGDINESGLRFRASISGYAINDPFEYGMIIIPADFITTYSLSGDYVTELDALVDSGDISDYINAPVVPFKVGAEWYVRHSIAPMKDGNFGRDFIGIAYAKDGAVYNYASFNVADAISLTTASSKAINQYNSNPYALDSGDRVLYEENMELLEGFITTGVANVTDNLKFEIIGQTVTNQVGDVLRLNVDMTEGVELDCLWKSSNTSVATVDKNGHVTMRKWGTATITASSAGMYTDTVEVSAVEGGVVAPFNTSGAVSYFDAVSEGGLTATLNTNKTYVYSEEEYSLHLNYGGSSYSYGKIKNAGIADLNAKDAENDYLYDYMSFSIYLPATVTGEIKFSLSGSNSGPWITLNKGAWNDINICRDTNEPDGFDGWTFSEQAPATDLNTLALRFQGGKFDLYVSAIRVGEFEDDAVLPLNTAFADKFITTSQSYVASVNSDTAYTYADEKFSLLLERGASSGDAYFTFKNSLITNLNAKDAQGNYLYDYFTFSLYGVNGENSKMAVNTNGTWASISTKSWHTYTFLRDGNTANFTSNLSSSYVANLNTYKFGIRQSSGTEFAKVYVSAVRAGKIVSDESVAVSYDSGVASRYALINGNSGFYATVASSPERTYRDEAHALRLWSWTTSGRSAWIQGARINNIAEKDADGKYIYNTITLAIYIESGNAELSAHVLSGSYTAMPTNKWIPITITRDGDTDTFSGENFGTSKTITQLNGLSFGLWARGVGDTMYVSAIRVS